MDRLIEEFVLDVYKNQDKDVESILNRYIRSLKEEDRERIAGMSPLFLESGTAARQAKASMRELIIKEAKEFYHLE